MSAEEELTRLAAGPGWYNPLLKQRANDTLEYAREVRNALAGVRANWESNASGVAQDHLVALTANFTNARKWLKSLEKVVHNADTSVQQKAAEELAKLHPRDVPQRIFDAIYRGDASVVTDIGVIALSGVAAPIMVNQLNAGYAKRREEDAEAALEAVRIVAKRGAESYMATLATGFDVEKPAPVSPPVRARAEITEVVGERRDVIGTGLGVSAGISGAGALGAAGRYSTPPAPGSTGGSGNFGLGVPGSPGRPVGPGNGPDGTSNGDRPGEGSGGDGSGSGTGTDSGSSFPPRETGPSVDSGLGGGQSGFGLRSGLGAAGLGAAGLAAGAKLASSGGAGGLGGLGAGVGGLGGVGGAGAGTAGMAGTTGAGAGSGAGGANSGAGGAKGAGAGAGKPGMMMGGQGGGGADKKGGANRLGYVAPKFEDDYEESMPHPASRAGKRGE